MIQIEVGGIVLTEFKSVTVSRTIAAASGSFSVQVPHNINANKKISIRLGKKVVITIDGTPCINGYIESIATSYDGSAHTLNFSGRDRTADFIDSSIQSAFEVITPISLVALMQATLDNMGLTDIKIIDEVSPEPFGEEFEITAEIGQTGIEFIEPFTRVKQVLLTTDGAGNLMFVRAGSGYAGGTLINKIESPEGAGSGQNNIKAASFSISSVQRFHFYIVKSQDIFSAESADSDANRGTDIEGLAFDREIRNSRVMIFEAEENVDTKDAGQRAEWESNLRRARAINYNATVQGHSAGGVTYQPNQIITVTDDFSVVHASMLVESVEYSSAIGSGNTTKLKLVPLGSYTIGAQVLAIETERDILGGDDS